jgi:hypothetical protein
MDLSRQIALKSAIVGKKNRESVKDPQGYAPKPVESASK